MAVSDISFHQCAVIEYLAMENISAADICEWFHHVYGDVCMGASMSEGGWTILEIETQMLWTIFPVIDQEASQLNSVSRELICSSKKTKEWQGNCSTAWHRIPYCTWDDRDCGILLADRWMQQDTQNCYHSCFSDMLPRVMTPVQHCDWWWKLIYPFWPRNETTEHGMTSHDISKQ
jgi:hypothetical protein